MVAEVTVVAGAAEVVAAETAAEVAVSPRAGVAAGKYEKASGYLRRPSHLVCPLRSCYSLRVAFRLT
jgi:hypothetical protein